MREGQTKPSSYRFGSFELDKRSGELRKNGTRIRLQDQPLQILLLLLEHSGEVVTREQIQHKLWPPDTYVDYDNAINSAMRKLREALSDDSGDPRFIETMARRGYRFVAPVSAVPSEAADIPNTSAPEPPPALVPGISRKALAVSLCGAVLVLAVAGGLRLWLKHPFVETKPAPLVPVPLTAASGWEFEPSLSPDGNQVVYTWDEGKGEANYHICMKLIGEGKPVRLTSGPGAEWNPAWSPDGRAIAFSRILEPARPTTRILVIPALGGAERLVAEGPFTSRIAWSPDGRFLAVAEKRPGSNSSSLILLPVEGGDKIVVTNPPDAKTISDSYPAFSPDGSLLLFTRCGGSKCGLYLLDLAPGYRPTRDPRLLRQESGNIFGTTWTASGEEVVYSPASDAGLNHHLVRIRAQAVAEPEALPFASENAVTPSIAPHQNRLVYSQYLRDADIWQVHPGETPRSFASSTRWEDSPQYSPDGRRVAFASSRSGLQQIWACDGDGGNPVQLTHFEPGAAGTPRWSPDGRWIAFDHREKMGWRIFVMASDGGQVRRLAEDKGESIIPSWSGDGKWIYYANDQTGRYEIWKRPAQGGPPIQLTHDGGYTAFESHDGRSLYYLSYYTTHSGLWELPLGGGAEKKILESVFPRSFVVMDDGIYYIPAPAGENELSSPVRFHSFATGQDREIARLGEVNMGLTVSPDRKTILFTSLARTGSNIMIVDNFR